MAWPEPVGAAQRETVRRSDAKGRHGEVRFFLQRITGGLYVEREDSPRHGARICQSLYFEERADFDRWWADDRARFEHPLLHLQLQRDSDELWRIEP